MQSATLVSIAVALLFAGSAHAAPVSYTDAKGDSVGSRPSLDIVSVTYDVRQVNKSGPPSLVIEMELSGPPEARLFSYETRAEAKGCGYFSASYAPGSVYTELDIAPAWFQMECGSPPDETGSTSTLIDAQMRITGNTLRWSLAMDSLPKELRGGSTFSQLRSYTQLVDPLAGAIGTGDQPADGVKGPLPTDTAASDKTWTY